jgi:hypothetical protein
MSRNLQNLHIPTCSSGHSAWTLLIIVTELLSQSELIPFLRPDLCLYTEMAQRTAGSIVMVIGDMLSFMLK